ncbi:MAG: hypothetical protein EP298_11110 [Gammaproteobacteria bacterium]|nr:MAG: hypothetical protein EP298_11110 [Gammaproteobacteria bacterium]UTW43169.1 hypothetical protein KFE69_03210 [bacterium SCSIO 12844]
MATIDDVLKATTDLNTAVSTECQRIEDKLNELELYKSQLLASYNAELARYQEDGWPPHFRLSRNQIGTVTEGILDYFSIVADCDITFEVIRTIRTGIVWEDRDAEEQAILSAMGKEGITHTLPEFNIIKMTWTKKLPKENSRLFLQSVNYHTYVTHGSYAKLVQGNLRGSYFEGITNEWGLCGGTNLLTNASYATPHPYAETETGEVHFCLLGTLAGRFPIIRSKPRWGYFPYLQSILD